MTVTEAIARLYVFVKWHNRTDASGDAVREAFALVESRERAQRLRPLRWYTDARDGLCPDEVSK